MNKFVHIHTHSTSSTRDGLATIDKLVEISKSRNELFAITDHGSIQGWMQYYTEARKAGIKPIFGIETYINPSRTELMSTLFQIKNSKTADSELNKKRDELSQKRMHLILIAKNITGFYNILQIANDAYVNGFYSKQLTDYETIFKYKEGIIVTTACLAGPIREFYDKDDLKSAIAFVQQMQSNFGDDFYLEVQVNEMAEQKKYNAFMIKLHEKTGVKLLCGIDSHYINKEDNIVHQDLLLVQNKNKAKDIGKLDIRVVYENKKGERKVKRINPDKSTEFKKGIDYKTLNVGDIVNKEKIIEIEEVSRVWQFEAHNLYFKSKDELLVELQRSELKKYAESIMNNHYELDSKIDDFEIDTSNKLPHIDNADTILTRLCAASLRKLKENGKLLVSPKRYVERLKIEMDVIQHNGFSTYFLILADIIAYCKKNQIALGAGRGSAVSSLVSYLLEITRIDPLDPRWSDEGLPFERFLDTSRNAAVITISDGENEFKFYENDQVNVIRNKKEIVICAKDIKENDEILLGE